MTLALSQWWKGGEGEVRCLVAGKEEEEYVPQYLSFSECITFLGRN